MDTITGKLNAEEQQFYAENGYLYPIRVFSDTETAAFRRQFDDYTDQNKDLLGRMIPRERRAVYGLTHLMLPWVYQMASHPQSSGCGGRGDWPQHPGLGLGLVREVCARSRVYFVASGRSVLEGVESAQGGHRLDSAFSQHARERVHAGNAGDAEDGVSPTGNVCAG